MAVRGWRCHPVPRKRGGVIGPATSGRTRWRGPPPPLSRGGKQIRSRDAAASEFCVTTKRERNNFFRYASRKTGRRSAERRTIHWPHRRRQVCAVCATVCRCGGGSCGSRSPSGAPAALAGASERSSSAQAALHATKRTRALPAPSIALKPGTWRPGRHAGRVDARTARERVTSPPAGTALAPSNGCHR